MAARKTYVPARRNAGLRSNVRLHEKVFAYFTTSEKGLVAEACEASRRSISSFVAEAAIEKAKAVLRK